jgi:hypothetical protein
MGESRRLRGCMLMSPPHRFDGVCFHARFGRGSLPWQGRAHVWMLAGDEPSFQSGGVLPKGAALSGCFTWAQVSIFDRFMKREFRLPVFS